MPRLKFSILAALFLFACGGNDDRQGDADATEDVAADTVTDETVDTPSDTVPDEGDPAEDPDAGDPDIVEDTVEDPDIVEDATGDPDVAEDTPFDPVDVDAVDATGEDAGGPDISDVTPDSTCGGTPFIRTSDKGLEYTTGGCNPDGSTTEALVAADLGGCCISVDHYCAWFNCCSTLVSSLSTMTMPPSLRITETETGAMCFCEGWFSPSYEVCGLTPGTWTVWIGTLVFSVVVS